MSPKKISKNVLDQINSGQVKQKPRIYFVVRNVTFWLIFALSIFVGSRVFATILTILKEIDAVTLMGAQQSKIIILAAILPVFWLVFFALFVIVAMIGLQQTKKGYRISVLNLVAINLVVSLVLGATLHILGDGKSLDRNWSLIPFHQSSNDYKRSLWNNAPQGRVAGTVIEWEDDDTIILEDRQQKYWRIEVQELNEKDLQLLEPGERIRVLGEKESEDEIEAMHIRPF